MNSWPFHELKRQVVYKAAWDGVSVVAPSVKETRGTTMSCYRCGERLQDGGKQRPRKLWCQNCEVWEVRDIVGVMNISRRGWVRFTHLKGEAGEAVKGNPEGTRRQVILRVDASKSGRGSVGVLEASKDQTEP
jgi:transposase